MPYSEHDDVSHPISLYAATKRSNELLAHSYAHLYNIPCTGLRFFTVYGPWGRPDMAPMLFAQSILNGRSIEIYNHGRSVRDFTYIDDIVEGVMRILAFPAQGDPTYDAFKPDPSRSTAPYRLFNIGNNQPIELMTFIKTLETALGRTAEKVYLPICDGDVAATHADTSELEKTIAFRPTTPLYEGVAQFVAWHTKYYGG